MDKTIYSFDHSTTKFPLQGQHADINCRLCHKSLVFSEAKTDCNACHTDMHNQTLGTDCSRCHTPKTWLVTNITQIHRNSRFPLVGVHTMAACVNCHKSESALRFDVLGTQCVDCHRDKYLASTNPNHSISNISTDCAQCHKINDYSWSVTSFDHSKFPLTEGHAVNDCSRCHTNTQYAQTSTDCITCHQNDFATTNKPIHLGSCFSTDCTQCHTTMPGWKPTTFDHSGFPLEKGHAVDDCSKCHSSTCANTSKECWSCHQANFIATTNPVHTQPCFSTDCTKCHTTDPGWQPVTFSHKTFSLTGGHANVECSKCHTSGVCTTISTACWSCHQTNFNTTTNPVHTQPCFSTDCTLCHTTNPGWTPATFSHTNFALTGGHANLDCTKCHTTGLCTTISTACWSCHQTNYNATTNPVHSQPCFSTDCTQCHTTNPGWAPSTFTHNLFSLTAGHSNVTCSKCHTGSVCAVSTDCYSCHQADYNATTNPVHLGGCYPTTCTTCHTTNPGWQPVNFSIHDTQYFPISTGKHSGFTCIQCHTTPSNCNAFSCTVCHNQTDMNDSHSGVSGYSYNSAACYNCHPRGIVGKKYFKQDIQRN